MPEIIYDEALELKKNLINRKQGAKNLVDIYILVDKYIFAEKLILK